MRWSRNRMARWPSMPPGGSRTQARGRACRHPSPTTQSSSQARFLLPGFVDTHVHFPQTLTTDEFGGGELLEWLERCVFPAESRLADPVFADLVASEFVRRRISAGTTSALVFGSAFPEAQDALFTRTLDAGLRVVSGRGIQTVGPASAAALLTTEDDAIGLTRDEIARWHGQDAGGMAGDARTALAQVAVVPRFSLAVTPETLARLGDLYAGAKGEGVYFHSHLNENDRPGDGEIAAVRSRYEVETYLDTYDGRHLPGSQVGGESLLGRRSILAHAVHCTDGELHRIAETGSSIAHCPTSQLFLGSGTMPWRRTAASGATIAIGTDIGAGDEWLIPRVLNDCYKVHMSEHGDRSTALEPAQLLFLGTLAGARALDQEKVFGNFDTGKDADFVIVDPAAQPGFALAGRGGGRRPRVAPVHPPHGHAGSIHHRRLRSRTSRCRPRDRRQLAETAQERGARASE